MLRRASLLLLALVVTALIVTAPLWPQSPATGSKDRPYVLLISIDGFRYDYAERFETRNLIALGKQGVRAQALLPSYPSTTFPNHYTIVTGLYPAHHGIVENSFWDPVMEKRFLFSDAKLNSDPRFWGGTPLWVLAEKQGVRAASYFWPGSDVEIQGTRPSIYHPYDAKVTPETKVNEVVSWLKLPPEKRPHFMTMYFPEVDHEGHTFGPDAPETRHAAELVDRALGDLFARIAETGVPVNVFVVSDHGMVNLQGWVDLNIEKAAGVHFEPAGTEVKFYSSDAAKIDALKFELTKVPDNRIAVYKQNEIPERLHYTGNPRIGDLVVLSMKPFGVAIVDPERKRRGNPNTHGFDVSLVPQMRGIFYAAGPNIKPGMVIAEFENIHIYPLIAKLLGLQISEAIDGDVNVLAPILLQP